MTTVVFETLWASPFDGWSIAARAYARAMLLAGWDVRLKSPVMVFSDHLTDEVRRFLPLERPTSNWDAYIFSTPLFSPERMTHIFPVLERARKPRMLYTMFERTEIQPELAESISRLDGCFVPCIANGVRLIQARADKAPDSWWTIPLPFFDDDPHLALPPPTESRVFAWHGRWEPRKSPDKLLRAFMRAFRPREAELVMKLGPVPWKATAFPSPAEVIHSELDRFDAIKNGWTDRNWEESISIISGALTENEMLDLEARTDVYVSPSRGEGIDLPAFRARLAGRRLVITESGGPEDFVDDYDIIVRQTGFEPAPEYQKFWGKDARLIEYPLSDLTGALVEARSRPVKKRETPRENQAPAVARRFREWIELCLTRGK